jgi:hypothetical protein
MIRQRVIGGGLLRQQIEAAATTKHVSLNALTVLSAQRDPYRLDTPAGHALGQWFAAQVDRFVSPGQTVHLRGLHYRLVSAPVPTLKTDGKQCRNNDDDWTWLIDKASKAGRWLGYVSLERIRDERNEPPEVSVTTQVLGAVVERRL